MSAKTRLRDVAISIPIVRRLARYLSGAPAAAEGIPVETQAAMCTAYRENRLIMTEYAYCPSPRPLEAAAGRELIKRLGRDAASYAATLRRWRAHVDALARIPRDASGTLVPFWDNPWFPPFDGVSLYGLIAENRPRRYIEIGSGMSTRFARRAISDLGLKTNIVSIDPHPHSPIGDLCDKIIVSRLEEVGASFWQELSADDMLFIDSSHRSFPGSDVTVFFTEIMPAIPAGAIYGMHDVFLPYDYPKEWMPRFYNEQYLLMAFLLGGGGFDEILLPVFWASRRPELSDILQPLWNRAGLFDGLSTHGASFWLRRRSE